MWFLILILCIPVGITVFLFYGGICAVLHDWRKDIIKKGHKKAPVVKLLATTLNILQSPVVGIHYTWCRYALDMCADDIKVASEKIFGLDR